MTDDYSNETMPSTSAYQTAFLQLGCIPDSYVAMLQAHDRAPQRDVTATQLASAVGYKNFNAANLHYGKLGRYLGELLQLDPRFMVHTLVLFEYDGQEWHWFMRPQVAQVLAHIRWKLCKRKTHQFAVPI